MKHVVTACLWALCGCSALDAPELPPPPPAAKAVRWASQGLDQATRTWLHHASLGEPAVSLSLDWFFALEQPSMWLAEKPLLSDPSYLRRFGFLLDADDPTGLPIGFTIHERTEGTAGARRTLGLACAACHTGELVHEGVAYRFDGGPSRLDLARFEQVLALSLWQTRWVPGRERRAIARIAGDDADPEEEARLAAELEQLAAQVQARVETRRAHPGAQEGPGRFDLVGRLANELFVQQLRQPRDAASLSAPVRPPPLWGASWFAWGGYAGSTRPSPARDAAKALGTSARLHTDREGPQLRSSVDLEALSRIRGALAGPLDPYPAGGFTGLRAPSWPEDAFGPIDRAAAIAGEQLYDALCMDCHLPPPNREDFFDDAFWTEPDAQGARRLRLPVVPLERIGTDPDHARRLVHRTVHVPGNDGDSVRPVTEAAVSLAAEAAKLDDRGGTDAAHRSPEGYRARPLDGAWATAPYLHNGSVPTLHALLSPLHERPRRFATGTARFDPQRVGVPEAALPGDRVFDTTLAGNHNSGHLFDEGEGPGIVGRRLSPEERHQLVEFLKTLESRRLPVGPAAEPASTAAPEGP